MQSRVRERVTLVWVTMAIIIAPLMVEGHELSGSPSGAQCKGLYNEVLSLFGQAPYNQTRACSRSVTQSPELIEVLVDEGKILNTQYELNFKKAEISVHHSSLFGDEALVFGFDANCKITRLTFKPPNSDVIEISDRECLALAQSNAPLDRFKGIFRDGHAPKTAGVSQTTVLSIQKACLKLERAELIKSRASVKENIPRANGTGLGR